MSSSEVDGFAEYVDFMPTQPAGQLNVGTAAADG
jgi:hypothetical protein